MSRELTVYHKSPGIDRCPLPPTLIARKAGGAEPSVASALRQRIGNQGIRRLVAELSGDSKEAVQLRALPIQAKLALSQPADAHEREADRVADAVMRMLAPAPSVQDTLPVSEESSSPYVQRFCAECDDELGKEITARGPQIQRKEQAAPAPAVTPNVIAGIHAMRGSGSALPAATRSFFEPRFGADFSDVRVHTDARAEAAAHSIGAKAFTVGRDIAFGNGEYAPASQEGRRLLAHELTHVVQQSGNRGDIGRATQGRHSETAVARQGGLVQRQLNPTNLQSSANVRAMKVEALQVRYDAIVEAMRKFNASTPELVALQMELDYIANELSRREALKSGRTFGDAEIGKMKEYFINNATSESPKSCIACMNDALRILLGDTKQKVGSEVEKTMAKLQQSGHAGNARVIEFEDSKGRITKGTLYPERLHESVWDAVIQMSRGDVGWSVFGMSVMDGNHSVTLTLSSSGAQSQRIYWSDQWSTKGGWKEYDRAGLDAEVSRLIQAWWKQQPENRKFNTRITLWRLNQ